MIRGLDDADWELLKQSIPSLRDFFAGCALIGLNGQGDDQEVARWAYQAADAMLEARAVTPDNEGESNE